VGYALAQKGLNKGESDSENSEESVPTSPDQE